MQPNFMSDTIRTFTYTKNIRDNTNPGVFTFKLHTDSATKTTKSYG